MHLRGTRDRIGVRISFVRVLAEENYKYNIGNPHRQHLQSFPDNQPCQWSIWLREQSHFVRRALKCRAGTERDHMGSSWFVRREVLGMKKKVREIAKLKKQGSKHWSKQGERLENFGSGKIIGLLQIWGKQECSWGVYCAVQKEKVWGHVTMVAKFLGEVTALFTNTSSLVPSRPRGFRMWRPLSKHAKFKNERWNTETLWRRCPFSDFSWGEGGLYTG